MKKCIGIVGLTLLLCVARAQTNNNTLLWRIDSKTGDKPSYLFGTIHLAKKDFLLYTDSLYNAIQQTDKFYNEVDLLNPAAMSSPELLDFLVQKKKDIDSLMKTPVWERMVQRINQKYNTNLDPGDFDGFVTFGQKQMRDLYKNEPGILVPDIALARHAKALGKPTGGLETYMLQYKMIFSLVNARLSDTTFDVADEADMMRIIHKFYLSESLDSIGYHISFINPTYRKMIFDERNVGMADSIEKQAADKPGFFAVGAGHLPGSTGVIELLRQRGYTVSPVHSSNRISMMVINAMLRQHKPDEEKIKLQPPPVQELDAPAGEIRLQAAEPPPPKPANNNKSKPKTVKGNN